MTANRRIFLNIIATYGRSLYALLLGLITARWTLEALGVVNVGILGVVGGLTAFISFFNGLLSAAIGRFFAFSIGHSLVVGRENEGLEECRRWFSIALIVHTIVPAILIVIGYPLGIWAVESFLTIPVDQISSACWVFRFVCVSCLVGMVNVPFAAMYGAKQFIAELTVYSFVTSTLNAIFIYYMVLHPGDWLVKYSFWTMLIAVVPQVIICLRAVQVFPECRFRLRYCYDWQRIKEIMSYAGWQFFGSMGTLVRSQGMAILVNKFFGPALNTTMNMANNVAGQTETLANSLYGAFGPAIMQNAGAGNKKKMLSLCYGACKYGSLLLLLFAIPLSVEIRYVLRIWLKNPPELMAESTILCMVYLLLGQLVRGVDLAILADGKFVGKFMFRVGGYMILTLPVAFAFVYWLKAGFLSVFVVLVVFRTLVSFITMPIAKEAVEFSAFDWIRKVLMPVGGLVTVAVSVANVVHWVMPESFVRLCCVAIVSICIVLSLGFMMVLDRQEKTFVLSRIKQRIGK